MSGRTLTAEEISFLRAKLAASEAREARLREALQTAIERLNADAQRAGQNEDAQWVCPDCGAVAPDAVQHARMARPPSGEHADGCEFVAMIAELRAALAAECDCECQKRSDDASVERLGGEGGTTPCGHCENGIQEQAGTGALRVCPKCGGSGTDGKA